MLRAQVIVTNFLNLEIAIQKLTIIVKVLYRNGQCGETDLFWELASSGNYRS